MDGDEEEKGRRDPGRRTSFSGIRKDVCTIPWLMFLFLLLAVVLQSLAVLTWVTGLGQLLLAIPWAL